LRNQNKSKSGKKSVCMNLDCSIENLDFLIEIFCTYLPTLFQHFYESFTYEKKTYLQYDKSSLLVLFLYRQLNSHMVSPNPNFTMHIHENKSYFYLC